MPMMAPQFHHHQSVPRRASTTSPRARLLVLLAIMVVVGLVYKATISASPPLPSSLSQRSALSSPHDAAFHPLKLAPFLGTPWRTEQTLEVNPVVSTAFGICELHKVKAEDGAELEGWLWFDEKDQINVLARMEGQGGKEEDGEAGKFLIFEQRKYGYEGSSLAPIGGLVEPGEEALAAAKRELQEEAGLVSSSWTPLGRYRISSTRGGGFLNVFFADSCHEPRKDGEGGMKGEAVAESDDREKQRRVYLGEEEVREAVLEGRFKEAKWTQTVSLALLWLARERERGEGRSGGKAATKSY